MGGSVPEGKTDAQKPWVGRKKVKSEKVASVHEAERQAC